MKVLHVITGLADGGAEACLYRLIATTKNSVSNYVICLRSPDKYSELIEHLGVQVFHLNFNKSYQIFAKFCELYRLIKKINPDIVQTWLYHADLIAGVCAKLAKIPICWGVHNTELRFGEISISGLWLVKLLSILSSSIPMKIIFCSFSSRDYHQSVGYDQSKFSTIHNGVDTQRFYYSEAMRLKFREEYNLKNDQICLGMIARNKPPKDYLSLIHALAILKRRGYKLKSFFVGFETELLKPDVEKAGLAEDVYILGQKDHIPEILNGLDIFVLSSKSEACPNVLIEAMACGVYSISTDVGDCKYLVGVYGTTVPVGDTVALSEAIIEAISRQPIDNKLKRTKHIQHQFTIERMAQEYLRVWREII